MKVVFFFDDDMDGVMKQVGGGTAFYPVSKVITLDHFGLSRDEQTIEVLKIAKGRDWTSKQNLYDLLVKTNILSEAEFDYHTLRTQLQSVRSDL